MADPEDIQPTRGGDPGPSSTLAKHVAEGVDGKVLFAAFTGKARW